MARGGGRALLVLLFLVELGVSALAIRSGRHTDFHSYRAAAAALASGRDPYTATEPPYIYPPLLAAALVPALRVPVRAAAWGFALVSAALLTWSAARLARGGALVPLLALLFAPFALTQWNLQANAFVLALLVLARGELDAGRELRGGAALGLSIALKPVALLVAGWLLLSGRFRGLAAAALVVAASFLVVVPFRGARAVRTTLVSSIRPLRPAGVETYPANVSLNATVDRLSPERAAGIRHAALAAAILLPTLLVAWLGRRSSPSAVSDFLLAGTLLAAGLAWLHHETLLFPELAEGSGPRRARLAPPARFPLLSAVVLPLSALAAAWQTAGRLMPHGAALAAAAGTASLFVLWVAGGRRVLKTR